MDDSNRSSDLVECGLARDGVTCNNLANIQMFSLSLASYGHVSVGLDSIAPHNTVLELNYSEGLDYRIKFRLLP